MGDDKTAQQGKKTSTEGKKGSSKKSGSEKTLAPLMILRVRCACALHDGAAPANPWIRGLWVIWAPKPADAAARPAHYFVGRTDTSGYLTLETAPGDMLGGVFNDSGRIIAQKGQKYLFWLVRHPGSEVAREIAAALPVQSEANAFRLGMMPGDYLYEQAHEAEFADDLVVSPGQIGLGMQATGKSATKKPVKEIVLAVPPKPELFLPGPEGGKGAALCSKGSAGSKTYGGWLLYKEDLLEPKGKSPRMVQPFEACAELRAQVRRLQFHLGALRYLIGDHGHPYVPTRVGDYVNDGSFELVTWNSVMRFQADAEKGQAVKVEAGLHGRLLQNVTPGLNDPTFGAPKVDPVNPKDYAWDFDISRKYAKVSAAPSSASPALDPKGVCGARTAAAIRAWLTGGLRKPGGILVRLRSGSPYWIREDAALMLDTINGELDRVGFSKGVLVTHTYRDARVDALGAGFGRAKRSIHKTGFAFDLMNSGFQPNTVWPVVLEMETEAVVSAASSTGEPAPVGADVERVKVEWRLHLPLDASKPAAAREALAAETKTPNLVREEVQGWVYDPESPLGGRLSSKKQGLFLDFTALCGYHGFQRIHSFGKKDIAEQDWRGGARLFPCSKPADLAGMFAEITQMKGGKEGDANKVFYAVSGELPAGFAALPPAAREAQLEVMVTAGEAQKVALSAVDAKEMGAILDWIGRVAAKDMPADLAMEVLYNKKSGASPEEHKKHLEEQIATRFGALLAPTSMKKGNQVVGEKPAQFEGFVFECFKEGAAAGAADAEVVLERGSYSVGDEKSMFPTESFRIRPKLATLAGLRGAKVAYFPRTFGEAIGQEWWHFQYAKGLAMKPGDLAAAKEAARKEVERRDAELKKAEEDLSAAQAKLDESKGKVAALKKEHRTAEVAEAEKALKPLKAGVEDAKKKVSALKGDKEKPKLKQRSTATSLTYAWWTLIEDLGWCREAMEWMGYKPEDFTATAS